MNRLTPTNGSDPYPISSKTKMSLAQELKELSMMDISSRSLPSICFCTFPTLEGKTRTEKVKILGEQLSFLEEVESTFFVRILSTGETRLVERLQLLVRQDSIEGRVRKILDFGELAIRFFKIDRLLSWSS